ncbi:hypothetical protein [Mycobacterium sp. 852002-50816_SCH5313054-b]|uniref:hypothetical protein n=1 Tax=Mycobacterium sp. 852002-50816_SCH5313054-b TaxID=1834092 RepID=UPI000A6ED729
MPRPVALIWLEVDDVVTKGLADAGGKAIVTAGRLIPRRLARAVTRRLGGGRGRS